MLIVVPAEPGLAETYLGRSLRPWWGASPLRMLVRGVVQGVLFGVAVVVGHRLRSDGLDIDPQMVDPGALESVGLVVLTLGVLGLVLNAVRIVVAVVDMFTVHTVDGVLRSCRDRRRGDVLPDVVQDWIWSRGTDRSGHEKVDRRPVRTILVVDTAGRRRSWTVQRANLVGDRSTGRGVRIRTTRLLGHVSRVDDGPRSAA